MGMPTGNSAAAPAMTHIERGGSTMMSKENALEICRMRKEGYGPTAIARHLGLPVSTVKGYIYRHFTMRDARCQYCGKIIRVPKHPRPGSSLCGYCRERFFWG